jgi:hypothetical protein
VDAKPHGLADCFSRTIALTARIDRATRSVAGILHPATDRSVSVGEHSFAR